MVTVLDIVSIFSFGVSATNFAVSVLDESNVIVESVLTVVDESTLVESDSPPFLLPLHAPIEIVIAAARAKDLNAFSW